MARWCARHGARVTCGIRARRAADASLAASAAAGLSMPRASGCRRGLRQRRWCSEPTAAPTDARIAGPPQRRPDTGILVQGEFGLFARAGRPEGCARLRPAAGHHRHNGKTTVTAMTGAAGRARRQARGDGRQHRPDAAGYARRGARRRGARGTAAAGRLGARLPASLGGSKASARRRHVVLNVPGPPRLARHMAAYAQAKALVFGTAAMVSTATIHSDGDAARPAAQRAEAQRAALRRGPPHPGDFGIVTVNGMAWLVRAMEADEPQAPQRGDVGG